jgi:trans-2,3-dihydro-3-hydroxyanthranilate isomerase
LRGTEAITLDLRGGPVTVRFRVSEASEPGVLGTMQQRDPVFGSTHARDEVARVIGVPLDDLDEALPVQTVSTGLPFCIVPLRSLAALQRL